LIAFHHDLRDAMFVEIPDELAHTIAELQHHASRAGIGQKLTRFAQPSSIDAEPGEDGAVALQRSLAELLLFEAVRLRLLLMTWTHGEFERVGGEDEDIDEIAWSEIKLLLAEPALSDPHVRPIEVMFAAASVTLTQLAAERADTLRTSSSELSDEVELRANLRAALRELRLPEAVLLENALATLLGNTRVEVTELQKHHRLALGGLSRQAMDQRVSRGRRSLALSRNVWPVRKKPALFDLVRQP
jgi:hypothetical protein